MAKDRTWDTAMALITAREVVRLQGVQTPPPVVQTRPQELHDYAETKRLTLSSVGTGMVEFRSGFKGWLTGATVFADAVDSGDTFSMTLQGRLLKDGIRPQANFSHEEDFNEPVDIGDRVRLYYASAGTTTKHIDFTPSVKYE